MIRSAATSLFACLSVVILACSSPSASSMGSPEEACAAYRTANNARDLRCRSGSPDDPAFDQFCARLLAAPGIGSNAVATFKSCAEKLATIPCDQYPREVAECDFRNIRGSLADGAACAWDSQCASGECAGGDVEDDDLRCGKCAPRGAVGATCGSGFPSCATGTICRSSGATGTCQVVAQEGQACDSLNGPSCDGPLQCDNTTKKCIGYPKAGAACASICAGSLRCIDKTCQLAAEAGGACPTGSECGSDLSCNATTLVCEPRTRIPVGGACGTGQVGACEGSADCSEGVCKARLEPGASCDPKGIECVAYYTCVNAVCSPVDPAICK